MSMQLSIKPNDYSNRSDLVLQAPMTGCSVLGVYL